LDINDKILAGTRIGVEYAGQDSLLHYRFWVPENKIKL
jgi:3-methyladenine DNA glycosylase Mpg